MPVVVRYHNQTPEQGVCCRVVGGEKMHSFNCNRDTAMGQIPAGGIYKCLQTVDLLAKHHIQVAYGCIN